LLIDTIYSEVYIALFILLTTITLPLVYLIARKNFNLFEPIYSYIYFFTLAFVYTTFYVLEDTGSLFKSLNFDISDSTTPTVIYLISFSIICFYIGYMFSNILHKDKKFHYFNEVDIENFKSYIGIVSVLYLITILFRFYGYSNGFLGSTASETGIKPPNIPMISAFYFLSNNWYVFFTYFAVISFSSNKYFKIFMVVLALEFLFTMISGNRRFAITIILSYLASYWYIHRMFPWKKMLLPSVLILFVFLPISTVYGYFLANNIGVSVSFFDTVGYLYDSVFFLIESPNGKSIFDYVLFPIVQSFNLLWNTCVAYTQFYLNEIQIGAVGVKSFLGQLLPTILNPEKHTYSRQFLQMYGDYAYVVPREHSTLSINFLSEMIISYGVYGMFIGMFIIGFLMNFFYKIFNTKTTPPLFRIYFISNIVFFSYGLSGNWIGGDLILTYRLLIYFVILYAFYKILLIKNPEYKGGK